MMMRSIVAGLALMLLATGCSDDEGSPSPSGQTTSIAPAPASTTTQTPTTAETATTTTTAAATTTAPAPDFALQLGDECSGIEPIEPFTADLSFVVDGSLYIYDGIGFGADCVMETDRVDAIRWGPGTDQVLLDAELIGIDGSRPVQVLAANATFSRPTGSSLLTIADDGQRLVKSGVDGSEPLDLSFLADHDEAVYYPSGTHIGVVGTDDSGEYGVWIATNIGTDPTLVVDAGEGVTVSSARFADSGAVLYFVADHGTETHLHQAFILAEDGVEEVTEFDATILMESTTSLHDVVLGERTISVTEGACGDTDGIRSRVTVFGVEQDLPDELAGVDNRPVGDFRGQMIFEVFPDGCDRDTSELWAVPIRDERMAGPPMPLIGDVEAASMRTAIGAPPPPPTEGFGGFA